MNWKRSKSTKHETEEGNRTQNDPPPKFSFSYWISKLKHQPKPANPHNQSSATSSSPPHAGIITRRLSIDGPRPRNHNSRPRHASLGSESELFFLNHVQTRKKKLKSADPVRIRQKVRVRSPRRDPKGFERYAVVKRSMDLAADFRESMVEMILEQGIGRPDELERLLACYLSLNADEHHDLIVKVFRQVWFDLCLGVN